MRPQLRIEIIVINKTYNSTNPHKFIQSRYDLVMIPGRLKKLTVYHPRIAISVFSVIFVHLLARVWSGLKLRVPKVEMNLETLGTLVT